MRWRMRCRMGMMSVRRIIRWERGLGFVCVGFGGVFLGGVFHIRVRRGGGGEEGRKGAVSAFVVSTVFVSSVREKGVGGRESKTKNT